MKKIHEIDISRLSPYIRLVNDFIRTDKDTFDDKILYDHEFIFCLSGNATLHYRNHTYRLTHSSLAYIKPGIRNQLILQRGSSFHAHCIHFDWYSMDDRYNFSIADAYWAKNKAVQTEGAILPRHITERPFLSIPDHYIPPFLSGLDYGTLAPLFKEIYYMHCQEGLPARLKEKALFIQIVAELINTQILSQTMPKTFYHQMTVERTLDYIQHHYSQKITVESLSQLSGLSPKYFGVLFKSIVGIPVNEYLMLFRLDKAKRLLLESKKSVASIAEDVGIPNIYYFERIFKKREGISPGAYRKILSQSNTPQ